MTVDTVWLQEMSWVDVRQYLQKDDMVIVPIGSTEVHGAHMPLGHDTFQAIDYAEGIAREAGIVCAPPIWFGESRHHMGKPGTITLQSETVIAVLKDVYRSLIHHGFRAILTFNGHRLANLPAIRIASIGVKEEHPEVFFAILDPLVMAVEVLQALLKIPGGNWEARLAEEHGGEWETSHLLYKRPHLVRMEQAEALVPEPLLRSRFVDKPDLEGGDRIIVIEGVQEHDRVTPKGFIGDPTVASAEKGERIFRAVVNNGVEFIEDVRQARKEGR